MLPFSEHTLELLRINLTADLQIFVKPQWGSQNPNYRETIRADLRDLFNNKKLHTSISHCQDLGIVVASSEPLGVDVRVTARVEERVVARISSREEMDHAPHAAALWCAKESCFKALRTFNQPPVASRISIGAWENIDSHTETYRLLNAVEFASPSENKGIVVNYGSHTYSFFIFFS